MTLTDYQREFNGLTLGDGTVYNIPEESGLEGFEIRSGSRPIPRDDGSIPGLHTVDSKTVVIPVEVVGDPETEISPAVEAALSAFAPSRDVQRQYRFKNPGDPERFVWARSIRFARNRTIEGAGGVDGFQVALEVADPRIYSVELHQENMPEFETTGGGFDWTVEWPLDQTAATGEFAVAVNTGSRDASPRFVVQVVAGTMTSVTITNLTNDDVVQVDTSVTAGQQLTMDFDALVRATGDPVIHIGGASRYGDWVPPRDPFRLSPGSNTLQLEQTGATDIAATVSWRDTN